MRVKVSLMGDMCRPWPAMMSVHDAYLCAEMPTPMMWMPGFALQQNKLTKTVFHKSQFLALEGHDCGNGIPHLVPPAIILKLPLIMASSKRKVMFSSSTVKAEDNQIACAQLNGGVPLPMLTCGSPVAIPNSFPVFNHLHSTSVNMTVGDLLAGLIGIALAIACDILLKSKYLVEDPEWLGQAKWLGKDLGSPFKELLGARNLLQFGAKLVFGLATNAARLCLTGEGEFKVEVFPKYAGIRSVKAGVEIKRDGRKRLVIQSQSEAGEGTREDKRSLTWKNGHLVEDDRSSTVASEVGIEKTDETTNYGDDGLVVGRQEKTVWSSGSVSSPLGNKSATSSVSTLQMTRSVPSQGTSVGYYQGSWGPSL
jgi:hypothetical protein